MSTVEVEQGTSNDDLTFKDIYKTRWEYIETLKEMGMRPFGFLCIHVPEELIHAAGYTPIRILTDADGGGSVDQHISTTVCPFIRGNVLMAVDKKLDVFEGIVVPRTCDGITKLYDQFKANTSVPFVFMFKTVKQETAA